MAEIRARRRPSKIITRHRIYPRTDGSRGYPLKSSASHRGYRPEGSQSYPEGSGKGKSIAQKLKDKGRMTMEELKRKTPKLYKAKKKGNPVSEIYYP